jgi:sugar transferase (PEP-CTERM/EpsH1 system associated)
MKPHLAHIVYSLQIGGLEELVLNVVRKANREKYRLTVIVLRQDGPLALEIEKLGVQVHRLGGGEGFSWALVSRLATLLRQEKIDLVHTHDLGPFIYGGLAMLRRGNRNLFHTEHSYLSQDSSRLRLFEKWLSLWARMIIADSADVARVLIEQQKIAPQKVVTILNGIDLQRFAACDRDRFRRELGVAPGQPLLGTVGRLVPVKNQSLLLRAFARLRQEQPAARLVLVGDGPERAALEEEADGLGLGRTVFFTGSRRDIPEIMAALDIFILPSFSEGLSLTLLEAMAAGKPVVATRVGGNPEVIRDGSNGLLVASDQVEELAAALRRLLAGGDSFTAMLARAGQQTVADRFSLTAMVQAYEAVYAAHYRGPGGERS